MLTNISFSCSEVKNAFQVFVLTDKLIHCLSAHFRFNLRRYPIQVCKIQVFWWQMLLCGVHIVGKEISRLKLGHWNVLCWQKPLEWPRSMQMARVRCVAIWCLKCCSCWQHFLFGQCELTRFLCWQRSSRNVDLIKTWSKMYNLPITKGGCRTQTVQIVGGQTGLVFLHRTPGQHLN